MVTTRNKLAIGQRFGYWTVISFDRSVPRGNYNFRHYWTCRCDCGTVRSVSEDNLVSGKSLSCGCRPSYKGLKDLTGRTFSRLTVVSRGPDYISPSGKRQVQWLCECSCGTRLYVTARNLVAGNSTSCGCYHAEVVKNRTGSKNPSFVHGKSKDSGYRRRPKWWSQAVKRRDDVCIACQDLPQHGHAHHLESWARDEHLREEVSNGVYLCDSCHYEFHHEYGKVTTKAQFIEWLAMAFPESYTMLIERVGYNVQTTRDLFEL